VNPRRRSPDIAIEIVSEDSHERDYHTKRRLYEEAGVREYWILDPIAGRHEFLRLRGGVFESVTLDQSCYFVSEALPGFWLNVNWLHADPLPDEMDCLQQILAGPPPARRRNATLQLECLASPLLHSRGAAGTGAPTFQLNRCLRRIPGRAETRARFDHRMHECYNGGRHRP